MVGDQAEAFHVAEAKASLSDKVVPIKPVPIMYVCMDGTGVPVVKKETAGRQITLLVSSLTAMWS